MNDPNKRPEPELKNIIIGILFMLQWPAFALFCEWFYRGG